MKKWLIPVTALVLVAALVLGGCLGKKDPVEDYKEHMITLAGAEGSAEYKAAWEWYNFTESYDQDRALLGQVGNGPTGLDEKYDEYFVYTQEMADKLDEILAKYSLKMHTDMEFLDEYTELTMRLRGDLGHFTFEGGYIYDDDSFQFDGLQVMNDGKRFSFQFRRTVKGCFDEVMLNIFDEALYETWDYVTGNETPLRLMLGPDKALVLADTDRAFVAINVLTGSGAGGAEHFFEGEDFIEKADLEEFVEYLNWGIL